MTELDSWGKIYGVKPLVIAWMLVLPWTGLVQAETARLAQRRGAIEWIGVRGGTFTMGSDEPDLPASRPRHQVATGSFEIARTQVTFRQYKACVAARACAPAHVSDGTCYSFDKDGANWGQRDLPLKFQGDDQPVVCVDWRQAQAFAKWAGGRLPSEAQWEYAARGGGKDRRFPWGDADATCERAVISDSASRGAGCGRKSTWPVCSLRKGDTAQGLCDMAGNVAEWTQDWFHETYSDAPADGSAWQSPPGAYRVVRGGAWSDDSGNSRAAHRGYAPPEGCGAYLGIRLVR